MEEQDGTIKLALVQMNVVGGELDLNLEHAAERIARAASEGAHLALLPEVMDLGWTHPSAKKMAYPVPGGKTFEHLAASPMQNQIYVAAGIVEKDDLCRCRGKGIRSAEISWIHGSRYDIVTVQLGRSC